MDPEERDLRWEILQQSSSNADSDSAIHLDGPPHRMGAKSIEEAVAQFQPFRAPPPPVSWAEQEAAEKNAVQKKSGKGSKQGKVRDALMAKTASDAGKEKKFKTTIIVTESTDESGFKYYTAQTTPIVQIKTTAQQHRIAEPETGKEIADRRPQGFLDRMRDRQREYLEYREERTADRMEAISVKRQRKLKMKKHKYKKLMKRTRNLRRRLDRN